MTDKQQKGGIRSVISFAAFALFVAAVIRELRTPAEDRQWHGRIIGVPYDLRPPSLARVKAAWWNPDDPRLLTPRAFGVGWAVNLARIRRMLSGDT
jgi:uncharacterized membrane protein